MQLLTRWILGPIWQGILLSIIFHLIPYGTLFAILISLLVTLRQGILKGLVIGLSGAVLGVLIRFLLGGIFIELNFNLLTQSLYWTMLMLIPAWFFAALLRQVVSLNLTLQAMTLSCIGLFALCFYGQINLFPEVFKSPVNEYVNKLTTALVESQSQNINDGIVTADSEVLITPENIEIVNRCFIHLFEIVTLYSTYMLLLMLARSWQSYMFMPKEFSKEFRMLRTGGMVVGLLIVGWLLDLIIKSDLYAYIFGGSSFIASTWLFIVGIAFFHWTADRYKLTWKAFVIFYLLLFVPIISGLLFVLLVLIGITDGFIDLRGLLLRSNGPKQQL